VGTPRGTIASRRVVLATGPFLAQTAALAAVELDIRPTRRQKLLLADVPEVPPDAAMTIEEETAAHWRPAHRGAYLLFTDPAVQPSAPAWNVPPSAEFAFRLLDPASPMAVAKVTPFWRRVWERGPSWVLHAGQYEYTPDRRPFVGTTGVEGLFVNGGYSGHGIMGSTGGSRLLVDLVTGRSTGPEWGIRPRGPADNPFRLDRAMPQREFDIL
jgi:sarcosine oxidase subunit beta